MTLDAAANSAIRTEIGFFWKLANGDFGLAKTYWLYGFLVSVLASITSNAITSIGGLIIFILVAVVYDVLLIMGTWRAANKYQGPKTWAVLAKISVFSWAITLPFILLAVVGLSGQMGKEMERGVGENLFVKKELSNQASAHKSTEGNLVTNENNAGLPVLMYGKPQFSSSSSSELPPSVYQKSTVGDMALIPGGVNAKSPVIMDKEKRYEGAAGSTFSFEVTKLEIKKIQSMLKALGYTPGPADGVFGNRTQLAIRQFETDAGLYETGNPSAELLRILESRINSSTDNSRVAVAKYRIPDRHNTNYGETVGVQNKLKELGYYTGEISGVVDSETSYAITRYQKANNIIPSSEPGQVDFNILRALRLK